MSKTADEVDGTFAVLVTKYKRVSKIGIVQDVTSWASVDGWSEFDHALRNEMIEPIPGQYEFGAVVYRPTAKGLHMLENPQSGGHPSSKVPAVLEIAKAPLRQNAARKKTLGVIKELPPTILLRNRLNPSVQSTSIMNVSLLL